jgi:hypothetical protein
MARIVALATVVLAQAVPGALAGVTTGVTGGDESVGSGGNRRLTLWATARSTARFHSVKVAERHGYEEFLECFDSPKGGMGQHYVNMDLLGDGDLDVRRPEAMVYEVKDNGRLKLVAVEWILPGDGTEDPPTLLRRHLHYNSDLGVWVLHAWIWKYNPSGMFADYNPRVGACPAA